MAARYRYGGGRRCIRWMLSLWAFVFSALDGRATELESQSESLPKMYAYFEPLSFLDSGKTAEQWDAQLLLWQDCWRHAGWQPIVLTRHDVTRADLDRVAQAAASMRVYNTSMTQLRRYFAMSNRVEAHTVAWMSALDVFPLKNNATEIMLSNPAVSEKAFAILDTVAPSMAAATGATWNIIGMALLRDWQNTCGNATTPLCFWSETLGVLNLIEDNNAVTTIPLQRSRSVAHAEQVLNIGCRARSLRRKVAIQFGPRTWQTTTLMALDDHVQFITQWLQKYHVTCGDDQQVAAQ